MTAISTIFRASAAAALLALSAPAFAQDAATDVDKDGTPREDWVGEIEPVSGFTGEMSMTMETEVPEDMAVEEVIRFEPWQMLDDLFRDDLVFLMRSGPSDWEAEDASEVAAQDCENQRLLTETGQDQMRQLGALLVVNGLRPGKIFLSEWCRSQQTYLGLETGMVDADMNALDGMNADMDPALNPFGVANGAQDIDALRQLILDWDGGDGDGPMLLITHFDNIAELTEFNVYEGEMLIVDPTRDGRVLGYLRLGSAAPDSVRYPADVVAFSQAEAEARAAQEAAADE
ncbi:MAG: hypothetical protein AAF390_10970 [Pseudomonadota bacterium]